jgi:hypothetical protein
MNMWPTSVGSGPRSDDPEYNSKFAICKLAAVELFVRPNCADAPDSVNVCVNRCQELVAVFTPDVEVGYKNLNVSSDPPFRFAFTARVYVPAGSVIVRDIFQPVPLATIVAAVVFPAGSATASSVSVILFRAGQKTELLSCRRDPLNRLTGVPPLAIEFGMYGRGVAR